MEEVYGLFTDFLPDLGRRLTDCLRILAYGFLPDLVRIVYGFLPTDFYRIWGKTLTDCLRIFTGFLGFLPEEARLTDCLRIFTGCRGRGLGLFTDFYRIWGRRLTDCLRIFIGFGGRLTDCLRFFTGFGGGGLRIVYGFLPDLVEEAYGLFTVFYRIWGRRLTDFYRIWGRRLTDCLRIFTGFGGQGLRIVYGWDLEDEAYGSYGFLPFGEEAD